MSEWTGISLTLLLVMNLVLICDIEGDDVGETDGFC
jgi:hypothetical protein